MGIKTGKSTQPNAPELQQMLLESSNNTTQPPHNPYYPDLAAATQRAHLPPPPYSDLTAPMRSNNVSVPLNYIQGVHGDTPRQQPIGGASVVVNNSGYYDYRAAKRHRKVRSFNNEAFIVGLLAAVLTIIAYKQYEHRSCIMEFTVHKPAEDLNITIGKVRDLHIVILYVSAIVMLVSLAKCMSGECKSYSCYKLTMFLICFAGAFVTGYTAYLAFYSPCGTSTADLIGNAVKTVSSKFLDHIPAPEKGFFGETNIFQHVKDGHDIPGLIIFLIDAFNFILYVSLFLSATIMG